ncbi:WD40 repeat domain-containing protein [Arcticibacter eurypsychrophilus]|uniref:WD40 repeat domain-containing protein n=1 Tax=Arcticibacter eurypsychrophilus TaxID=1434752 RepID=UPI00084DF69F|nr:WD40 repeat domain-containing protein [Arcticibacter eurypsychrophilus]
MIEIEQFALLPGHQNSIYSVEPGIEQGVFYTAGNDKGIVQWNLEHLNPAVLLPVKSSVYAMHVSEKNRLLIFGERSGQISIYSYDKAEVVARITHHLKPVFCLTELTSKNEIIAASEDGTVSVISSIDYTLKYNFKVSEDTVRCMALSSNEQIIAFGCKDNTIRIYNATNYSFITNLNGHTGPVTSLAFSPSSDDHLLSGGRDAKLILWNVANFTPLKEVIAHMSTVYDIKFHPFAPIFATCSQDKSIKLWDLKTLKLQKIISKEKGFITHSHSINKIAWTKDGQSLVSVGDDKLVIVWSVKVS